MSRRGAPIRIVIIDPQTLFRAGLKKILSGDQEFQVAGEATSIGPALEMIHRLKPQLVLIEISLSGLKTRDAVGRVHQVSPQSIVVLLGSAAAAIKDPNSADGVLLKTSSVASMLRNLRRLVKEKTTAPGRPEEEKREEAPAAAAGVVAPRETLTPRELDILGCIVRGWANREIARQLSMQEQTVKNYLHSIFDKLGVSDRLELALYTIHHNLVPIAENEAPPPPSGNR